MLFMAFSARVRLPLPELRMQYADVARREQDPGTLDSRRQRLAEWVGRLDGLQPPATLPPDHPRTYRTTHPAKIVPFAVPDASMRVLRAVAEAEGVTLFMLGLTALAIALRTPSTRPDEVTFGVPVANRTSSGTQALIGPFVNILPVRLPTPSTSTVRTLLLDTRTVMLDAFVYQEVPFDDVLEAMYPGRPKGSYGPAGCEPVFRVCVDFAEHADPLTQTQAQGRSELTVQPFETDDPIAGCDMFVSFAAGNGTLGGIVLYNAELFERSTIASFIDRFQAVLGAMDKSLDARLSEL
jgi:non-ribosomal peptide synthetase component F